MRVRLCVSLSLTVRLCARGRFCVCLLTHAPSEDGADVHALAGPAHCSTCLKKKGFSLFVSNFTGRPNGHRHASKINK